MGKKLSGNDITVTIGSFLVQFEQVTLSIEDNSTASKSGGRPNGYTVGDASASGEITLDTDNFNILSLAAKSKGSWQELGTFDINMVGATSSNALVIVAHECLLKISDLLDADANGGEKLMHKLPFEVTGKDFVHINGTPYLESSLIDRLL